MNLKELKSILRANPDAYPRLVLPDGDVVPAHYHITEVGYVTKRFIDCGGTVHDSRETCLLQTWHSDNDLDHRLSAGTFAKILDLGDKVLPRQDLEVEVEYDDCAVTQFPIEKAVFEKGRIDLHLAEKHTDCLAKEKCGCDDQGGGVQSKAASCC
jgi:hypothetical protein